MVEQKEEGSKSEIKEISTESPQNALTRFYSKTKKAATTKYQTLTESVNPVLQPLKNPSIRYSISFILLGLVVALYVLFETYRGSAKEPFMPVDAMVPLGLVFAFLFVLYFTWDDKRFSKFRSPGIYVVLLTTIFYILIFSGVDQLLFELAVSKWLTKLTGTIVSSLLTGFGMQITSANWNDVSSMTYIQFTAPSGLGGLNIDAACSGIHSLTIFFAIFILMLIEARKRLQWNYKAIIVTIVGLIGTYLVNILRISIVVTLYYFYGSSVGDPVHNYLGYALLILWVPVFWLFILPFGDKDRSEKRTVKKAKRKAAKENKKSIEE